MARRKRIRWKRVIAAILVLLLLICSLLIFATFKYFEATASEQNILLLGTDGRMSLGDDIRRSDTIMLINVRPNTGDVNLVSVPRDSLMPLACREFDDKINHGYAYAFVDAYELAVQEHPDWSEDDLTRYADVYGAQCVRDSIENYFEIKIDEIIMVDFDDMISLIDVLGGISITSTATFCEMNSEDVEDAFCFDEGVNYTMSGEQALSYARHRKTDDDFARNQRQQDVMSAVFDKIQSVKYTQIPKLFEFFQREIYNTYEFRDMMDLVFVKYNHIKLNRIEIQGIDDYDGYTYYFDIYEDSKIEIHNIFDKQD